MMLDKHKSTFPLGAVYGWARRTPNVKWVRIARPKYMQLLLFFLLENSILHIDYFVDNKLSITCHKMRWYRDLLTHP